MTDPKVDLHHYLQSARDALLWKLERAFRIRHPPTDDADRHEPAGAGQTPDGCRDRLLRRHLRPAVRRAAALARPTALSSTRTCGPPPTSHASTSSGCTAGRGRTRTRRSTHWRWTPSAGCRGGRDDKNEVTLHHAVVRVIADTHRHAGHADVLRELMDGTVGMRAGQHQPARSRPDVVGELPDPPRTCGTRSRPGLIGRHPAAG